MSSGSSLSKPPLAAKDAAAFKSLLMLFENKLYKKALKQAEQILRAHPEHGETLAVKGLVLAHLAMDSTSSTDKDSSAAKNEAAARVTPEVDPLELIKAGVRLDTTSFICWQVLGLYHRLKRNFAETLRCYKTALRFEPHQPTILRDSALLQAHERQFAALVESRNMLLRINASEGGAANAGQMWRALSIAYAMAGQPEAALRALEASFATKEQQQDTHCAPGTRSELMRFKWKLEALAGHPTTARVTDNVNIEDAPIADADLQDEAVALYSPDETLRALACSRRLERNPDLPVSSALVEHQNAVVGHTSDVLALGRKLEVAVKTGNIESFGLVFTSLLNEGLLERAPISLFKLVTIAAFDQKPSHIDVRTIHQTISNLLSERQSSLATVIFQALLLDAIGNSIEALGLISSAIGPHHPKGVVAEGDTQVSVDNDTVNAIAPATENIHLLVDAFTVRAKIHKHLGLYRAAADDAIAASKLACGDRSLTIFAIRHLLRADKVSEVEHIHLPILFKKPMEEIRELQVAWYLVRAGEAFWRLGRTDEAVEAWSFVALSFLGTSLADDVFDFHGYALRRCALVGYMELLTATPPSKAPILHKHPTWQRAACNLLHAAIVSTNKDSTGDAIIDGASSRSSSFPSCQTSSSKTTTNGSVVADQIAKLVQELAHFEHEAFPSIPPKLALRRRILLWLYEDNGHRILPFLRTERFPKKLATRVEPLISELQKHGCGTGLLPLIFTLV
ncbi:hypothetical protein MDAP_002653 [Mitosporidium daphniae]